MNATEGRDWIGNPDGTLVYWQSEAEDARAKLARIAALCDEAEEWNKSDRDTWFTLTPERIRAILNGGGS